MEQYNIRCLDCDEIFPGGKHACKKGFKTPVTAKLHGVNEQITRLDESTIQYSESSRVENVTHDQSLLGNSTKIISITKKATSDQIRKDKEPTCQTPMQQNEAFGCYSGISSVQQQSGDSGESLSLFKPELEKYKLSEMWINQKDEPIHFTFRDVANLQSESPEHTTSNALSSTSNSNMDASAGPSNGLRGTDSRETFDAEAYRREEDRQFECPFCKKSFPYKSSFLDHYRTHTGEKPYSCDMCEYKSTTKKHLSRHRKTHSLEKPHKCPFCEAAFRNSTNCKIHIKRKHKK